MTNIKPKINMKYIEEVDEMDLTNDVSYTKLTNYEVKDNIQRIEFNSCIFEKVDFSQVKVEKIDFIDCLFNKCDLSNIDLSEKLILRCEFNDCKLIGSKFVETSLQNVLFNNCNMNYCNFNNSRIKELKFNYTKLKDSSFIEINHNKLEFNECDLENSEFYNTKLKDIDLSTSTIEGILVTPNDLKGVYINNYQATLLIRGFGINIKDV